MNALAAATRKAIQAAGVQRRGRSQAIALDTTGSSVIPVGPGLDPLDDYYLWCDHRAKGEAAEITATGRQQHLEALDWCGGVYSSEWGFSKLLHWLRHNPDKRARMVTALEHCDMVAAVLCGITDPLQVASQHLRDGPQVDVERGAGRSAAGRVPDRRRSAVRRRAREARRPLRNVGPDCGPASRRNGPTSWVSSPAFRSRSARSMPIGTRSAPACREGDVVNVVGTSTCIMAIAKPGGPDPRRLRCGQGFHPSAVLRDRGRTVGDRRYLRRHRTTRGHDRGRAFARPRSTTAPARPDCCASPGTTAIARCW